MSERATQEKLINLEKRVRKLAADKAHLELVIQLMNRISAVSGLDNIVEALLQAIGDVIGGVNLCLYYTLDGTLFYTDAFGNKRRLEAVDDPLVQKVFETRVPLERKHAVSDTRMMETSAFTGAYTWVVPLLVGEETVAVIKIESLHVAMHELASQLPTFFSHAAFVLKNEILGETRLKKAYDSLEKEVAVRKDAEEQLRRVNEALEERVAERTVKLQAALEAEQQSEEALRKSAAEIEDLYNHAPCGYHSLDQDGVFVRVNDTELSWLGYTREEFLGKHRFINLLTPRSREKFLQVFPLFKEAGEVNNLDFEMVRKDGTVLPVLLNATAIRGANGEFVMSRSVIYDMTERRRAEEKDAALAAIVESSEDAIIAKTLDGIVTSWNRGAEKIYGYTSEEMIGRPISLLVPEHMEDEIPGILKRLEKGEYIRHYETRRRRKGGKVIDVAISISPIRNAEGRIIAASTIGRDISERKRAEEKIHTLNASLEARVEQRTRELTASEARFRTVYETAPVSIWQEDWSRVIQNIKKLRARGVRDFADYFRKHPEFVESALHDVKVLDVNQWTLGMCAARDKADVLASLETVFKTEDTLPGFIGELCALGEGKAVYQTEMALNTVKGDRIQVLLGMSFPPPDSDSGEVLVSIVDITQRKRFERALQKSEERMRLFFERQLVGMAFTSPEKGWLQVNDRICEILGYSRDELAHMTWAEMTYPEDLPADVAQFERLLRGEIEGYTLEKRFLHKDGHIVFTNLSVGCVRKGDGSVDYVLALLEDITERKRAEEAVRILNATLEERVQERTAQLKDAITTLNSEIAERKQAEEALHRLNRELRAISSCNQTLMRAEDEQMLLNQICHIVCHEAGYYMAWVGFAEHDEGKKVHPAAWAGAEEGYLSEVRFVWSDTEYGRSPTGTAIRTGQSIWIQDIVAYTPVVPQADMALKHGYRSSISLPLKDENANTFGVFTIYASVPNAITLAERHLLEELAGDLAFGITSLRIRTERKRSEEALKNAKEAAEAANRAKDQFIAVLSHELRTPLTPVLATVSALEEQETLPPDLRADLELIHRNADLEAKLIDDLLDITKISRGQIELHLETVDAHLLLRTALEICQKDIEAKRMDVALSLYADPHQVLGDPTRLRQVFWNLIKNAVEFTPEGGRISLRTTNVDHRLKIEIEDTGIGIRPELLPKIFSAFERGIHPASRRFGGLGLGLSIAKTVVEMHHGALTAFSKGEGKGATFTVELSALAPAREPALPLVSPLATGEPIAKILLVDDHPDTLRTMARLLTKWGYAVVTADCVRAALDLASRERFDMLISDLGLPDGSGLDIMREVKRLYALRGVALSGYGTEEDLRRSKEAGFERHLTKPVSFRDLRDAIRAILSGS